MHMVVAVREATHPTAYCDQATVPARSWPQLLVSTVELAVVAIGLPHGQVGCALVLRAI